MTADKLHEHRETNSTPPNSMDDHLVLIKDNISSDKIQSIRLRNDSVADKSHQRKAACLSHSIEYEMLPGNIQADGTTTNVSHNQSLNSVDPIAHRSNYGHASKEYLVVNKSHVSLGRSIGDQYCAVPHVEHQEDISEDKQLLIAG